MPDNPNIPGWFMDEMLRGIAKLARLNLVGRPGTPDAEEPVAEMFADVVWPGKNWDVKLDTPRIRKGFLNLAAGDRAVSTERSAEYAKRQFPQPCDLQEFMPRRELEEIEYTPPVIDQERANKAMERCFSMSKKLAATMDPTAHRGQFNPNWSDLEKVNYIRRRWGVGEPFSSEAEWERHIKKTRETHA